MADRIQLIDHGRVHCALQDRDVDIEQCLTCVRLRDLRLSEKPATVVCRMERLLDERPPI
jgi:hypothetical protein